MGFHFSFRRPFTGALKQRKNPIEMVEFFVFAVLSGQAPVSGRLQLGTDHYKSDGGGGGEFSACTNVLFWSPLVQEVFFQVKPSARICFSDKHYFFLSEISIHYLFCA